MSNIKIYDLNPVGSQLLLDNESYLNELTDEEISMTVGGTDLFVATLALSLAGFAFSYQAGRDARRRQEYRNGNACYA